MTYFLRSASIHRRRASLALSIVLAAMATVARAQPRSLASLCPTGTGGGIADAGLTGEYFATPDFTGSPIFTRRDVRMNFDFGGRSPAGSASTPFSKVPASHYSIRWTGRLLPRFSETYTLHATIAGSLRLSIRKSGAADYSPVITAQSDKIVTQTGTVAMTAGTPCDIQIDFADGTAANAVCKLAWSSPSTPLEIIEPASALASNVYTEGFTDAMKGARDEWKREGSNEDAKRDANGWPMEDAYIVAWEGNNKMEGTYVITFTGKADVHDQFNYSRSEGMTYNQATNTSRARLVNTSKDQQNYYLHFTKTQRDATAPVGSGVTNIRIYRPIKPGSAQSYPVGSLFDPDYEKALGRFVALRWMAGTNWNTSVDWEKDVTRPDYSTQHLVRPGESGFEGNGMAWEYKVALCNETGKDLYVCIPETANDVYITKLAQLIAYGSDGHEPYKSPQANPVYPPLNSNLKVYVEYSNEVWNVGFQAWHQNFEAGNKAIEDNTPEGRILGFDQKKIADTDLNIRWNRRHVL